MNGKLSLSVRKNTALHTKEPLLLNMRKRYQLWLMVIPAIVLIFIFHYVPMYGIQLAFKEFDFAKGLTGGEFVGLKYFEKFFNSFQFSSLMRNTFVVCIATLLVGFPVPIILALLLNQVKRSGAKKVMQTTLYAPHFISTVVLVGMLNVLLSSTSGVIGLAFKSLGFTGNLLGDTGAFVPVYVLSDVWQHAGWNSIIYLAALSSVDSQLYDACKVDGAGKWKVILHVDIPSLVPTMIVLLILSMGNILNVGFEKVFLMQKASNAAVSEVISTFVYKIGIKSTQYSYSAAIGLFNTLINFVMLMLVNTISKKLTDTGLF